MTMNIRDFIGNKRITDYSFRLASFISTNAKNIPVKDLRDLYTYNINLSVGKGSLYPQSNWQPHRLCLLSSIAVALNDASLIHRCHSLCLEWIRVSDCKCCIAKSQDFHWRDSCEYVVYGWWALCQSMVYLQPKTKFRYKPSFVEYFRWLDQYKEGKQIHVEYLNSKIPNDLEKPMYGKNFHVRYNDNLMAVYNKLLY